MSATSAETPGLPSLYDLDYAALEHRLQADGVRAVHARALWSALYRDCDPSPQHREGFPPPLARWVRRTVDVTLTLDTPDVASTTRSTDGTEKTMLRLHDGQLIETVVMGYPGRLTACVSTQAGCAMGCVFCATGQMGLARQLQPSEIVAQVVHVQRRLATRGERLRNIVLMGMGEPLHNYDAVMQALAVVTHRAGLGIGPAHITLNTVGLVPGILRLAQEARPYHLGVSLHGTTDEERAALVPITQRWPMRALREACEVYTRMTGRHVFFAWTLIAGVNDTPDQARRLAAWLEGLPSHVNLIQLNRTRHFSGEGSDDGRADAFRALLRAAGIPCTIRQRRGIDVAAGCGQLVTAARAPR